MSQASRTQVVDVTYDDHRTGERVWERKIQEVPYEEIEQIRGQELALIRQPHVPRPRRDDRRAYDDDYYAVGPLRRDRLAPPDYDDRYARRSADRHRDRRRDEHRSRRRRDDSSNSSSESSRERRHRRRHRRARSEQGGASNRGANQQNNANDDEDDGGRLWWSNKPRKEGKWHERNFDSSYDGLIAAAAGAAIGGLTAKYFGGEERKGWKIGGGAIAGATAFNLAENKYRLYTEEREEEKEAERIRKGKGKHAADEEGFQGPLQLGGALVAGGNP